MYEPLKADKNKVARALNLIQQDWFKLAAKKDSNPGLVEEHLNAFYSRFSNLLLERIVNMADLIVIFYFSTILKKIKRKKFYFLLFNQIVKYSITLFSIKWKF